MEENEETFRYLDGCALISENLEKEIFNKERYCLSHCILVS